jgi:uncharacterized Ntn-hydrolase superfamily protein
MSMIKEYLESIAKQVVDEAYEDTVINKDSEMYLGLVIGMSRLMNKLDKEVQRMSNIITETYADKLYEELYEKHYEEVGKTTDDVGYIEKEAERLALIDLDNFEMEG